MFWQLGTNPANIVKFLVVKPIYISLYVNMLLETVVIFVYCGAELAAFNMESNMRNYKTQSEYVLHSSELSVLLSRAGELFSTLPSGHAIVSDVNGGEFYGIESGKYYPTKLLLRLNRLIQTEGKYDWIQWHSDYDGLSYHVGHVCSNDYKFIHDISSLPENETYAYTGDPVIIEDPEITGRQDATTDDYWDCECEDNYINKKSDTLHCPKCNSREDEQPDSRVSEVEYLKDEEDAAERYFGSEAKVN